MGRGVEDPLTKAKYPCTCIVDVKTRSHLVAWRLFRHRRVLVAESTMAANYMQVCPGLRC